MKKTLYLHSRILLICIIGTLLLRSGSLSAQMTLQVTSPKYNGYNISCFGKSDGSIDLSITGGAPPYSILWSTNDTIEDLTGLPAGYYRVTVNDADTLTGPESIEITLTEPRKLVLMADAYKYPNNFNISLYGACNGMVSLTPAEGVAPYSYSWNDGNTSQNRVSLCAAKYTITLTDANNCTDKMVDFQLTQPDRNDWQLGGNAAINDSLQFVGTTDSVDLAFRTNNTEQLRINAAGEVGIGTMPQTGYNLVVDGKAGFREVYVKLNGPWPDYVFEPNYKLDSIEEVAMFWKENSRLPGFPSAVEIDSSGISLGHLITLQQETIETLYLYIYKLTSEIESLKIHNK